MLPTSSASTPIRTRRKTLAQNAGKPAPALTKADHAELRKRVVLTQEIRHRILECVGEGIFQKQACEMAGIAWPVYLEWKRWALEGLEPYASFFRDVMDAEYECLLSSVKAIRGGDKEWKAYAWFIDRRFPYWREDNTTDVPPEAPSLVTIIQELRSRYSPEALADIASQITAADPVIAGLLPEGVSDAETTDSDRDGGAVDPVSGDGEPTG